ncbi:MAG: LytR/AlgR family response regulator transcription factor [Negativibacillus sp.]
MDYRIAICDDRQEDREYVRQLTARWAQQRGNQVEMTEFCSAEQFLFSCPQPDFDLLLLDIEMGEMDGVSLAKQVRRTNELMQIVFITGYSDYITEGYEVAALHYLMKPVKEEKLFVVLDRAVERLHKNTKVLTLETSEEMVRVPLYQVSALEVQRNYVTVHARQDYTVKKSLSELMEQLDERFFRVGRSAVVNLNDISRVTRSDIYLTDGRSIPLPRGAYDKLNRAIIHMK